MQGFADLQLLLESGFHQLERFYAEAGGGGGGGGCGPGGAGPGGGSATAPLLGGGKVSGAAIGATSEQLTANGGQVEMRSTHPYPYLYPYNPKPCPNPNPNPNQVEMRSAVQKTLEGLRTENTVALDRQNRLLDALKALDPDGDDGDEEEALLGGGSGGGGSGGGGGGGGSCALVRQETTLALTGGGGEEGGSGFVAEQGERIAAKLEEAKATKDELARMVRQHLALALALPLALTLATTPLKPHLDLTRCASATRGSGRWCSSRGKRWSHRTSARSSTTTWRAYRRRDR